MNPAQGTDSPARPPLTPELIARQAVATPDAVAVVAGRTELTYAELDRRSARVAHGLRAHGAGPETTVGVRLGRGTDLVAGLLGIWRAGAAYLPLDPGAPQARLEALVRASGTRLVLCEAGDADAVAASGARAVTVDQLAEEPSAEGSSAGAEAVSLDPDGAAYVLHTSGSTGEPKGVVVSHEGIGNLIRWMVETFGFGPGSRVLQRTSLIFDAHVWEVFAPLACGGAVVLAEPGAERDPGALVREVAEHRVTTLQVVPSILRLMVAESGWEGCGALWQVLSGGEQLHAELAHRVRELADVEVWNTYGPTECSVNATAHRFDPAQATGPVPIGRPVARTRVLVADASFRPVGVGVPGELLIGGAGLARGYLGRPGQTADRFVPDPFAKDASRLYRTGDRVRWTPEGVLEYLGRADDQVKINGVRIEPGEIEAHLAAHPSLRAAVVRPYKVEDGGQRLAGYVVPREGAEGEVTEHALRAYLLERLPGSHVPSRFVPLDALPLGPTGKVDTKALPDPLAAPAAEAGHISGRATELVAEVWKDVLNVAEVAPGDDFFRLGGTSLQVAVLATRLRAATGQDIGLHDLLRTPVLAEQAALLELDEDGESLDTAQQLVADCWKDVLKVEDVAPGDDFFRLGGTSLQVAVLATRLRAATGQDIGLHDLLRTPILAEQAKLLGTVAAPAPATTVVPVPKDRGVPLSYGQRRLWFLDRLNPGSPEWVAGLLLKMPRIAGPEVAEQALQVLVDRHEALRTRYAEVDGEPLQFIRPSVRVPFTTVDCTREELPAELNALMTAGFRLDAEEPLLRGAYCRLDDGSRMLVVAMHHITTDGWSSKVLESEFHQVVDALVCGEEPELPALPVQYADYAAWQRDRLTPDVVRDEVAHWREVLDGAEPVSAPADRPRPAVRDGKGAIAPLTVPAATVRSLDALGREIGTTRFTTVLTALATVVARYTGQWDVPVGAPVSGRGLPELDGAVGFFLNTVVLRCGLEPGLGFAEAVRRTAAVTRDAMLHQELPFDLLVDELAPERDLSRTPLYQVAFDLHGEDFNGPVDGDLETLYRMWHLAHTDLTLLLRPERDGSLVGGLEYATSLFDHATAEHLASALGRALESAAADHSRSLAELPLLTEEGRARLDAWGRDPAPQPERAAHVLIAEQAVRTPDAVAVETDETRLTYRQLAERAGQIADHLHSLGVRRGTPVGVLVDRGPLLHAALLGTWWAGAAYLPIDPGFPADRVTAMLADAGASVLLTDRAPDGGATGGFESAMASGANGGFDGGPGNGAAGGFGGRTVHLAGPGLDAVRDRPVRPLGELAEAAREVSHPDDLGYVIYTSGSTGRPKGVAVTHRGIANHLLWAAEALAGAGQGGGAVFSSVAFDLVVPNLWAPLLTGQRVVLLPQEADLSELGERLVKSGPFSFLKLTPGHLDVLSRQLTPSEAGSLAARIVVAGEELPGRLAAHWGELLGEGRLFNEYGPTEASVGSTLLPVPRDPGTGTVPIGGPLPGMELRVLDEGMRPVPVGAVGELYVGGTGVARGYLGRAALTAERFLPDPYGAPGARLYRTGDLVRWRDGGVVEFLGRGDDQIKIRGHRVETGEIRTVLLGHPGVAEAVVVPRGEGSALQLVAYWTPAGPEEADERALTEHCARYLPEYMVPSACVRLDEMPLNRNGKVDRRALPDPAPAAAADEAPLSPVEETVQEIWRDTCGVEAGAHDNFFHRGGNSILAIRMIAEIRSEFDVTLPVRAVFDAPTVAGIARTVEDLIRAEIDQMSDSDVIADSEQTKEPTA
ncbi:amino acid adenylation domain-containing protein [Streptomyces sp. ODS28]|uniref:amino acid adenylation domain-containing protein n=1 Tax=Streptomyces sp. ODS28 TaxID=3136688 RepID=UPI0031E867CC